MKNIFALIIVVAAALPALSFQAGAGDWIKFSSEEGRFSILMPGPDAPKDDADTKTDPKFGQYTSHLFFQKTDKGFFMVGWTDYAPTVRLDVQGEIAANRDNFVNGLKGKLISEHPITLGENPGLEFVAESEQATFKSRVYVVGQRPYMIIAATFKGESDSENISRFLSSFELKTPAR